MTEDTPLLPQLSPIAGKPILVALDNRRFSVDGGVIVLQEVEQRLSFAKRLASCVADPRQPGKITHPLDEIIRFRVLAIAAGYPDGNDCDLLRDDPVFKMALDRSPLSGLPLGSQPTVSRLKNLPGRRDLYRMGRAALDLYCDSFHQVPDRITLDWDESFDQVHGEQELRTYNAHYGDYGFLPIHIFDTSGRLVLSVLRPATRPSGPEIRTLMKRVVGHIRERFPRVKIRVRGDSHYACPEVMSWCEANGIEYVFGLATNKTVAAEVETLEARTKARYEACRTGEPDEFKLRRYTEFQGGAKAWDCKRRIIARVEAGPQGVDTRFVVTNLTAGRAQAVYEQKYCQRGRMENLIKAYRTRLACDRTSWTAACANQFRLFLHAGAYWVLWALQSLMPKRSPWHRLQFDTLRDRLIKIVTGVSELADRIKVTLAPIFAIETMLPALSTRLARLVT